MSEPTNSGKRWTQGEVNIIKINAKRLTANQIAGKLQRTEEAIQQKAHQKHIKLKKP